MSCFIELRVASAWVSFRLPDHGALRVGRSSTADLIIGDPTVSRRHACLWLGARPRIQDLGSRHGVWINGERLEPLALVELRPGDVVSLGRTELRLGRRSARARTAPTESVARQDEAASSTMLVPTRARRWPKLLRRIAAMARPSAHAPR